jgi:hypothetical protein
MAIDLLKRFRRAVVLFCCFVLLLFVGVSVATFVVVRQLGEWTAAIDCIPRPPSVKPRDKWQALFTARMLYVGRTDSDATQSGRRFGPWAIAYVKHRYWGLPWWNPGIVVLAPGRFQEGETYFVEGQVGYLRHSRYLPIIFTVLCSRTQPLSEAVVDTRILSAGPPRNSVRIIGQTFRRKATGGDERGYELAPGMRVEIKGPGGSIFVVSDAQGVYDATGLPPGHYSINIEHPDRIDLHEAFFFEQYANLKSGEVGGRPVYSQ